MKKVFKHLIEKNKLIIPISVFIFIFIHSVVVFGNNYIELESYVISSAITLGVFILFIVILNFSYNKTKISTDLYYSLPIDKKTLFKGIYLFSILEIIMFSILLMLVTTIMFGMSNIGLIEYVRGNYEFTGLDVLIIFIMSIIQIIIGTIFFNFALLFYYRANSITDGLLYIVFSFLITLILSEIYKNFMNNLSLWKLHDNVLSCCPYYLLISFTSLDPFIISTSNSWIVVFNVFVLVFNLIIGFISYILILRITDTECGKRAQTRNNELFGYRVLIPLTSIVLTIYFAVFLGIDEIFVIFSIVISFILYVIYHKSIKFSKESYLVIAITFVVNIILVIILSNIQTMEKEISFEKFQKYTDNISVGLEYDRKYELRYSKEENKIVYTIMIFREQRIYIEFEDYYYMLDISKNAIYKAQSVETDNYLEELKSDANVGLEGLIEYIEETKNISFYEIDYKIFEVMKDLLNTNYAGIVTYKKVQYPSGSGSIQIEVLHNNLLQFEYLYNAYKRADNKYIENVSIIIYPQDDRFYIPGIYSNNWFRYN